MRQKSWYNPTNESSADFLSDARRRHDSVEAFHAFALRSILEDSDSEVTIQKLLGAGSLTGIDPETLRRDMEEIVRRVGADETELPGANLRGCWIVEGGWSDRRFLWETDTDFCLFWWGTSA
jgi:hypothetical protein